MYPNSLKSGYVFTNSTSQFGNVINSYSTEHTALEDWVAMLLDPTFYNKFAFKAREVQIYRRYQKEEIITVS